MIECTEHVDGNPETTSRIPAGACFVLAAYPMPEGTEDPQPNITAPICGDIGTELINALSTQPKPKHGNHDVFLYEATVKVSPDGDTDSIIIGNLAGKVRLSTLSEKCPKSYVHLVLDPASPFSETVFGNLRDMGFRHDPNREELFRARVDPRRPDFGDMSFTSLYLALAMYGYILTLPDPIVIPLGRGVFIAIQYGPFGDPLWARVDVRTPIRRRTTNDPDGGEPTTTTDLADSTEAGSTEEVVPDQQPDPAADGDTDQA